MNRNLSLIGNQSGNIIAPFGCLTVIAGLAIAFVFGFGQYREWNARKSVIEVVEKYAVPLQNEIENFYFAQKSFPTSEQVKGELSSDSTSINIHESGVIRIELKKVDPPVDGLSVRLVPQPEDKKLSWICQVDVPAKNVAKKIRYLPECFQKGQVWTSENPREKLPLSIIIISIVVILVGVAICIAAPPGF
jgi:hypothetical protein